MITEGILNIVNMVIILILDLLPPLGEFPEQFYSSISHVITIIFSNLKFLSMFVRIDTIKLLAPLTITVITFEFSYHLIMWIIDKISKIKSSF